MIKAIIIEDELNSIAILKTILAEHCKQVQVTAEANSIRQALQHFNNPEFEVDVAFLDINLPDGLVFQLLDELGSDIDFDIIFITAYEQHAIRAFKLSAIDYLLKPISAEDVVEAVSKVRPRQNRMKERLDLYRSIKNNPNAFNRISVFAQDNVHFINLEDIVRLEAEDNYTHIFTTHGDRITACKTIKSYEEMLTPLNFFRVHKSHLVNLNYMIRFNKSDGYIMMSDNKKIEVSRRRRPSFLEHLRGRQEGLN